MTNDPASTSRFYHVLSNLDSRIIPIVIVLVILLMFDFVSRLNASTAETIKETLAVETSLNKVVILSADLHEGYVKKLD